MGNLCSSCCKDGYTKIPDSANELTSKDDIMKNTLRQSVYQGLMIDQKFTSNHTFEKKFIWVNPENKTLHMSLYETKERRHKEASLADVVGVELFPPQKYKKHSDTEADLTSDIFMTVRFVRGGGIDLRFKTTGERNLWYNVLLEYVEPKNLANSV